MFPRRKTGSLIAALGFLGAFWYLYTTQSLFGPRLDISSDESLLEKPLTEHPLPPEQPVNEKPLEQEPLLVPTPESTSTAQTTSTPPNAAPHLQHGSTLSGDYPVTSFIPLPTGKPAKIAKLQHEFDREPPTVRVARLERRDMVKASFKHSWAAYKKHAWLKDEVTPLDAGSVNSFGGWAATLVDTLDTLWMMGMKEEFEEALESLDSIDFSRTDSENINVFETTIRYMGGFLGAYDISGGKYPKLLEKALEVGNFAYGCFDTPNRMPVTRWNWKDPLLGVKQEASENTLIAELGSLTLEFTRLSQATGDPKFFDAIQRITNVLQEAQNSTNLPGLWPTQTNARKLDFSQSSFTLGGMADSTYEYLPKQHLLLGGLTSQYKEMYLAALAPIKKHIFFRPMLPDNADVLISGSARAIAGDVAAQYKGQHLGCFTGGMVGIGAKIFDSPADMEIARKLVDGCIWAYNHTQTGIMPEVFFMHPCKDPENCKWDAAAYHKDIISETPSDPHSRQIEDKTQQAQYLMKENRIPEGFTQISDSRYILRPEAIESVFILYRLTGDKALQDAAWRMFTQIEKYTRTEIANAAIVDVTAEKPKFDNRMESFWLAETLKYFYAILSEPGVLDLDEFVL